MHNRCQRDGAGLWVRGCGRAGGILSAINNSSRVLLFSSGEGCGVLSFGLHWRLKTLPSSLWE